MNPTKALFVTYLLTIALSGCASSPDESNKGFAAARRDKDTTSRPLSGPSRSGNEVVALRVGNERVSVDDLIADVRKTARDQATATTILETRLPWEQAALSVIRDRVAELLLYQRASARLSPQMEGRLDQFIDAEVRKIVTRDHGGVQHRYERHLESEGNSLAAVREKLRREIVISSYLEAEVRPRVVEPARAELVAAFEARREDMRRPARRRMSLIDVRLLEQLPRNQREPDREQVEAARRKAREKIESAQRELAAGTPFADVARNYSEGLQAAEGGGWGWITPGSVRERFEPAVNALYRLAEGAVSEIIETADGFFLVRCDEIDPGYEPDFLSAQTELRDNFFRNAYNMMIGELVEELRRESGVDNTELARFHIALVDRAMTAHAGETP